MDEELRDKYVNAMFRFRKAGMFFPHVSNVNMREMFVMHGLAKKPEWMDKNVNTPELMDNVQVSKAAISKMFSALENKGYVIRETDKNNRRKITVELTEEGERVLKAVKSHVDSMLDETIARMGEEKTKLLISLLDELSDITEEVKRARGETTPDIGNLH
jgi:DNA-binding MarR family transcriptional regulator